MRCSDARSEPRPLALQVPSRRRRFLPNLPFKVVDNPRFQAERMVEFPSVNHPRTIREDTSISFYRTGDSKQRFGEVCAFAMLIQKHRHGIGKSRKTSDIKRFHWPEYTVLQKRKSRVRRAKYYHPVGCARSKLISSVIARH
jgi:hypothetical protein